jgi:hypothetical protein
MGRFIPVAATYLALNGLALVCGVNVIAVVQAGSWSRMLHLAGVRIGDLIGSYTIYMYTVSVSGDNPLTARMCMLGVNLEIRVPSRGPWSAGSSAWRSQTEALQQLDQ